MKNKTRRIATLFLAALLLLTNMASPAAGAREPGGPLRAVVLYEDGAGPEEMARALEEAEGVTLLCRYESLFQGAAVEAEPQALAALEKLPGVAGVGLAQTYEPASSSGDGEALSPEEGLKLMKADGLWEQGYTGDGTVIAVLDSGLNTSHEAFADGSLMESPALSREDVAEFTQKGGTKGRYVSQRIPFAYDYYSRDDDVSTTNNHGTHVTALAAGYVRDRMGRVTFRGAAPAAQILSMKVFPDGTVGGADDAVILRALEAVPAEEFSAVAVVTQYPEVEALASEFGFIPVHNPHPDWGISHTIRLGLEALGNCGGACFLVSDQPLLRRESVRDLTELWRGRPDKIAALAHGGVRGNPCIFPARFFPELLELREDHGGNAVIRRHEEDLILLETAEKELTDVDTPEALRQVRAQTDM